MNAPRPLYRSGPAFRIAVAREYLNRAVRVEHRPLRSADVTRTLYGLVVAVAPELGQDRDFLVLRVSGYHDHQVLEGELAETVAISLAQVASIDPIAWPAGTGG